MAPDISWTKDEMSGQYVPTLYPGLEPDNFELPECIQADFHRLNAMIESKYSREYLKICAFYNKMFPSLKSTNTASSSYNVLSFTAADQERADTGSGTNYNYLKQIVDQVTSRLGTISFTPYLLSEDQSYEFVVYKEEVERILRSLIRDDNLCRISLECFHNAAILGYAHVFVDPITGSMIKASDYEIGMFESQFNKGKVAQMLYRDYAFPTTEALKYLGSCNPDEREEMLKSLQNKPSVDFKMYFDCPARKMYVTIDNKTLPGWDYPFEYVLMATFQWDTGFSKVHTTSEFDLLYPIQREINRIAAKIQQLVRLYKGSVPVFNSDVDLALKAISNGGGEALFIDSTRSAAELMTVINPTPLDPQLSAQIQEFKGIMYELAGIQNASFDMENMRSAAAVVALDQLRDSVFQAQLSGMAMFIKQMLLLYIKLYAQYPDLLPRKHGIDWQAVLRLIEESYINMQPVHATDPLSDDEQGQRNDDYITLACARIMLSILSNDVTFDTLPYYIDDELVTDMVLVTVVKFEALGITVPDSLHMYLISAFINAVAKGEVEL